MDYHKIAKIIVDDVGGTDNIRSVTHCMTRLRFSLKDVSKVNEGGLGQVKEILGTVYSGDQYMIILGANLLPTYSAVVKDFNLTTEDPVEENLDEPSKTKWTF